jgi:sarcosine oxidase/L-pipecolate oxidase
VEESCIYTLTPDQNPIIDRIPEKTNIVVAAGFSGMGFKLGPVTGRMLADMAMDPTSKQEEDILNIQRFIKIVE